MTEDPRLRKEVGKRPEIPPTLTPPDATGREEKAPSRAVPLLILGCGLVLIIAALLVLLLPLQPNNPVVASQPQQQAVRPPVPQPPAEKITPNDDFVLEIDRLVEVWLQKQAQAEAVNIAAWGAGLYTEAVSLAKECNRLLGERQYLPAKNSCEGAIDNLDGLMASRETLLEEAVAAGTLAMEQGEPKAAFGLFQRALAIKADDERAITGLRRADQLPAVLDFIQEGLSMENAGNPEGALLAFSEAATLDPDFEPAQKALDRVRAEITDKEFQQAMSRALQALSDGKPSAAETALKKAESLKPGDRAVYDLKQQLAQTRLAGRLSSLRQDAERLEQKELWPEALQACEEALSLDSRAAFAASCKTRVNVRIDLDRRLNAIFVKPERLFEDGPLNKARQTLAHATQMSPRGPLLAVKIDQLDKLISQAEAEIEVLILSDGLTDVVIYHVGRLGRFQEKSLILRSGDYTATGSRNGFRDVRQTLKVRPGSGKLVFTLRCEEPI